MFNEQFRTEMMANQIETQMQALQKEWVEQWE